MKTFKLFTWISIVLLSFIFNIATADTVSDEDDFPAAYLKAVSTPPPPSKQTKQHRKQASTNDRCANNGMMCGDYMAKKIEKALGDMNNFIGLSLTVKVRLDDNANISYKTILRPSSNPEFDEYVINNITKAGPFTELLSLPKNEFNQHKTLNMTIMPSPKIQQKPSAGR